MQKLNVKPTPEDESTEASRGVRRHQNERDTLLSQAQRREEEAKSNHNGLKELSSSDGTSSSHATTNYHYTTNNTTTTARLMPEWLDGVNRPIDWDEAEDGEWESIPPEQSDETPGTVAELTNYSSLPTTSTTGTTSTTATTDYNTTNTTTAEDVPTTKVAARPGVAKPASGTEECVLEMHDATTTTTVALHVGAYP
jgi:hypothetical protein